MSDENNFFIKSYIGFHYTNSMSKIDSIKLYENNNNYNHEMLLIFRGFRWQNKKFDVIIYWWSEDTHKVFEPLPLTVLCCDVWLFPNGRRWRILWEKILDFIWLWKIETIPALAWTNSIQCVKCNMQITSIKCGTMSTWRECSEFDAGCLKGRNKNIGKCFSFLIFRKKNHNVNRRLWFGSGRTIP